MAKTYRDIEISNGDDVIDLRDVIERYEHLERELNDAHTGVGGSVSELSFNEYLEQAADDDTHMLQEAAIEALSLINLLAECEGNGGDEEWRGAWYPITLVRDSYFEDFARQEAEDLGLIKSDASWPYTCIDWERAARDLQMDYTLIDFDGVSYWVR